MEEGEGEEVKGNWREKEAQFRRTTFLARLAFFHGYGPVKRPKNDPFLLKNDLSHDLGCCCLKNDPKFAETLITSKSTQKR